MSAYARRYPAKIMLRARELKLAGWKPGKIADIIQRETGMRPSPGSIRAWCEAGGRTNEQRRHDRERHRAAYRRRNPRKHPRVSEDWKLERLRELRAAGLSHWAIGEVAGVWWGEPMSDERVARALGETQVRRRGAVAGRARAAA
jgi:hypothetical protein